MEKACMTGDLDIAMQHMSSFCLSLDEVIGSIKGLDEEGPGNNHED